MNVFFFCYREIAILIYLTVISIFTDSFMIEKVMRDLLNIGPGLVSMFVAISIGSNIALYFAFMDFKPKAKIIISRSLIWGPFVFILSLIAVLTALVNLATTVGLIWFFADQLF